MAACERHGVYDGFEISDKCLHGKLIDIPIGHPVAARCTSAECAARSMDAWADLDITELLPKVKVPTLVMQMRDDAMIPFDEGKKLAANISGARFVASQGQNHLFLENEPAAQRLFEEINLFLGR